MRGLFEAAREIHAFLRRRRWKFCIIGGLAVQRWGEPRTTRDVDITLLTGFGKEEQIVETLLAHFKPRIAGARDLALLTRVVLCRASNGIEIDIALGGLPYEERIIARATPYAFAPKVKLLTVSAEDLVVLKAFAGREQDWIDVEGILRRQLPHLEWHYVIKELRILAELEGTFDTVNRLKDIRKRVERQLHKTDEETT